MNLNQIVNMVLRMLMRQAVNRGVNAGISAVSNRSRRPVQQNRHAELNHPEDDDAPQPQQQATNRPQLTPEQRKARREVRMARRAARENDKA